jgi:hypothetical protein
MSLGLGVSIVYNQVTSIQDPTAISDLVGWWDFTKSDTLRQDRDGTGAVTANNDPVEWAKNLANGDVNGNILGNFLRSSVAGSDYGGTFKTGGTNGRTYIEFSNDGTDNSKGLRGGFFTVDSNLDGGVASDKFSDLVMDMQNFTVIQVMKHDDADIDTSNDYSFTLSGYPNADTSSLAIMGNSKDRNTPDDFFTLYLGGGVADQVDTNGQLDTNTHLIVSRSKNETNGFTMDIDGTTQTDTETPDALLLKFDKDTGGSTGSPGVCVGGYVNVANGATVNSWEGRIYETLVYNRAITDAELANLELYFADKYGLTIS